MIQRLSFRFQFLSFNLFAVFYLCQHINLAPNAADGALILEYIRMITEGKHSYWDFIDMYGPLNWYLPALFFYSFGNKVIGIRIWLICLKLCSIGMAYKIVKQSGSLFYAYLAGTVTLVLLGQPWQYLQTAYAFHAALPLTLLSFYIIIFEPFDQKKWNLISAGFLTALTIWIKLNTGAFLLAGGLFYYFYWSPVTGIKNKWSKIILNIGLMVYGIIFYLYIAEYFNKFYFYYLLLPLLLMLGWTYTQVGIQLKIKAWLCYLGATLFFFFVFWLSYFGWTDGMIYWFEIVGILKNLDYMSPFNPLGMKGLYIGFSENYWPQLPWLTSFLFFIWLVLQKFLPAQMIFRQKWNIIKSQISGLFLLTCLSTFVIYSRSDETHVFQAILPAVPVTFCLLLQIEAFIIYQRIQLKSPLRLFVLLLFGLMLATIGRLPSFQIFHTFEKKNWNNDSLAYLNLTTEKRYVYHQNDLLTNAAATYIDSITEDYTPVLILCGNQLLNYNSHTLPVGGRYQYMFYLLKNELIDRQAFDQLIPASILENLLEDPPKVIVNVHSALSLLQKIPEFKILLQNKYQQIKRFGHIFVYEKINS